MDEPGSAGTVVYHSISCVCRICVRLDECLQGARVVCFGDSPQYFYRLGAHVVVMKPDLDVPDGWKRQYTSLRGNDAAAWSLSSP